MPLDDQFQVVVIIDKLSPLWKNFKNTLRHKTKEFSLKSLIMRLRIEEEANTGASRHVCHDLSLFRKYNEVTDKNILLGDHHTTKVADIGEVEPKFTSVKMLVLKEVLHTPKIRTNLVYGYLLNKVGFTQTIKIRLVYLN
ncbi:retrotransposon protein, putative, Ty1-copia sub-class [Cucumis melo var. makuwa]|uniref:Retrotransposon protein, putative, Ty1-copia sub-class n=1 Tax=Cucumis melo var. makuwa TaxID=1194695 RepID=A0A5A7UGL3_CUCMM|nr:retrotransposon protein, putative, Ty1-copia sub-class [Cucumis melo var. makuwa]TYK12331.1 retrotransposon protein, putative, Ty1-copia sub-class [Cucumis melo var. makuwa]